MIPIVLCFLACFTAGFTSAGGSRAGSGNSVKLAWFFRITAHASWLFLFKDIIAKNILGLPEWMFYFVYITGYSVGQVCAQYLFIHFIRGKASVGGIDELLKRIEILENKELRCHT